MGKSKYLEQYNISVEGTYNQEGESMEIEEIGEKKVKDILKVFDGQSIKISIKTINELE